MKNKLLKIVFSIIILLTCSIYVFSTTLQLSNLIIANAPEFSYGNSTLIKGCAKRVSFSITNTGTSTKTWGVKLALTNTSGIVIYNDLLADKVTLNAGSSKYYDYTTSVSGLQSGNGLNGITSTNEGSYELLLIANDINNIPNQDLSALDLTNGIVLTSTSSSYNNPQSITINIDQTGNCNSTPPPCDIPSGFAETSVTQTSISLNWDSMSSADSYKLQYKESSSSTWNTESSSIGTSSYPMNGLLCGTNYDFRIRSNCGADFSSYTSIFNISTTSCSTTTWTISGNVIDGSGNGVGSVTVTANNSGGSDITDGTGYYSITVNEGWSGTVTASKSGCSINPNTSNYFSSISFDEILDFTADCGGTGSAPVANFTASTTSGNAPLSVQFTDQSSNNPTSWNWDFGDGATSPQASPSHTYINSGVYPVSLTVSNAFGSDNLVKNNYINVTSLQSITLLSPTNNYAYSSISNPQSITFSWTSTGFPVGTKYIIRVSDMTTGTAQTIINNKPDGGTSNLSFTANVPLTKGHNYLWRVIGFQPGQTVPNSGQSVSSGITSSASSFSVQNSNSCYLTNDASGLPMLQYPLEGCKADYDNGVTYYHFGSPHNTSKCGGADGRPIHCGIDIKVLNDLSGASGMGLIVGRKVLACYDGIIKKIGCTVTGCTSGSYITIEHVFNGQKFTTYYAHVKIKNGLKKDDFVSKGDIIGTVFNLTQYDHLHFGLRKEGYDIFATGIDPSPANRGILADTEADQGLCKCKGNYTIPVFPEKFVNPILLSWINNGCDATNGGTTTSINPPGSVLSGAKIELHSINYLMGYTDENGVLNYSDFNPLNIGDSIMISSPDYETAFVKIEQSIVNTNKVIVPMIKKQILSNNVMYPSVKFLNMNGIITNSNNINLKITAKNITKYEVIIDSSMVSEIELNTDTITDLITFINDTTYFLWDTLSNYTVHYLTNDIDDTSTISNGQIIQSYLPTDSLISILSQDTGINYFTVRFISSIDTFYVYKRFIYYPASVIDGFSYSVGIYNSINQLTKLYIDNIYSGEFINNTNIRLPHGTHSLKLICQGYYDTYYTVDTSINLTINAIPIIYSSATDTCIINFINNGNIQYWKNFTVQNYANTTNNIISLKQVDANLSVYGFNSKSRKFIFRNLNYPYWSTVRSGIAIDQIEILSSDSIYLMNIKNTNQFTKLPIDSAGLCSYDSISQKLTYNNINFSNGTASTEELVIMKKLRAIPKTNTTISIYEDVPLTFKATDFFFEPDSISDLRVQSISSPNLTTICSDSTITLQSTQDWNGNTQITLKGIHDGLEVAHTFNVTVIPVNDPPTINLTPREKTFCYNTDLYLPLNSYINDVDNTISDISIQFVNTSDYNDAIISFNNTDNSLYFKSIMPFPIQRVYPIELIITDIEGAEGRDTLFVKLDGNPIAAFSYTPACIGDSTTFTDQTIVTPGYYTNNWNFGDGTTSSQTGTFKHKYNSPGNYNVRLIVTCTTGCIDTVETIIVQPSQLQANISSVENVSCYNVNDGKAYVNASGGTTPYSYIWNTNPPQSSSNAILLAAGNYTVTVTDNIGCTKTVTTTITQPSEFNVSLSNIIDVKCYNGNNGSASAIVSGGATPFTYYWNSNPAQTGTTASNLVSGNYTLTVTDNNNCKHVESFFITQPQQLTSVVTNINNISCFGEKDGSATIISTGGLAPYSYLWNTIPSQSSYSINNFDKGTYYVTITDSNNCTETKSVSISEPLPLVLTDCLDTLICKGESYNLSSSVTGGTIPYFYKWTCNQNDCFINISNISNPVVSPLVTTNYSIVVNDANNCISNSENVIVNIVPDIIVHIEKDTVIFEGESIQLLTSSNQIVSYEWIPVSGLSDPSIANPIANPNETITYKLVATNSKGCTGEDDVTILVNRNLIIPTAFTPNDDGINDFWEIEHIEDYPNCKVEIYDRLKNIIFKSNGYAQTWDGKNAGKDLQIGSYYFIIDIQKGKNLIKGTVSIIK